MALSPEQVNHAKSGKNMERRVRNAKRETNKARRLQVKRAILRMDWDRASVLGRVTMGYAD
jgi:hypothetical protein